MKIISTKFIYKESKYQENLAVAFDSKIKDIDSLDALTQKYPNAKVYKYSGNSVLYPGFINLHTHLEFSANRATLNYGDFITWLYSVIENRDELVGKLNEEVLDSAIKQMLNSGVTTFGAISSFGADLNACVDAPQRVIYFNEVIGSNPAIIDALFSDFKNRFYTSSKFKSDSFYPAVAIHSPYSVHPVLLREALKVADSEDSIVSAHFLESVAEREWLEENRGDFAKFFKEFFNSTTAVNSIDGFLESFNKPTLFTHAVQAKDKEFNYINSHNHSVIHCPRSNRLLNCGKLDITKPQNLLLATDGLSSNYSLSILDELKAALEMHTDINPKELACMIIEAVTTNAAKAIDIKVGKIKPDYFADFAIFSLPDDLKQTDNGSLALNTIINTNSAKEVFIAGENIE